MAAHHVYCLLILCSLLSIIACHDTESQDQVKWQDLRNITFHYGKYTNGTGGRSLPQMVCGCKYSLRACGCRHMKSDITCHNEGISEGSLNFPPLVWSCESQGLDSNHEFDVIEISCDCVTDCTDHYISIKSCFLWYSVEANAYLWFMCFFIVVAVIFVLSIVVASPVLLIYFTFDSESEETGTAIGMESLRIQQHERETAL